MQYFITSFDSFTKIIEITEKLDANRNFWDGNPNYNVLEEQCVVAHTERFNRVNGFHSFIKERDRNALFSKIFGNSNTEVNEIYQKCAIMPWK